MQPNLWETMEAVLRGMYIALRAYIMKVGKSHTSDLTAYLKALEKKRRRQKEYMTGNNEIQRLNQ